MTGRMLRAAASSGAAVPIISLLERMDRGRPHLLPVLAYHRVVEPAGVAGAHDGLCVAPDDFERHLQALGDRYDVVSMQDLLDARRGQVRLPRRSLLLTFDDGYADFATTVWPMLRARSLPATVFVPTGYPARPERWFWWDRLSELLHAASGRESIATPIGELPMRDEADRRSAFARLRTHAKEAGLAATDEFLTGLSRELGVPDGSGLTMDWETVGRLAAEGATVAPHTRDHPILTELPDDELDAQLSGSMADLRAEIGEVLPCFAYPSGAHDDRVVRATEAAGYELAFTTRRGINDLRRDRWLRLRRINVGPRTTATMLRAQVGSWATIASRG